MTNRNSGQALLIAILLGVLLLITVPVVIFLNQVGMSHQMGSLQRGASQTVAEEGITYFATQLSLNSTTFAHTLVNNFGDGEMQDCNSDNPIPAAMGGYFKLTCDDLSSTSPGAPARQPYQVHAIVDSYMPGTGNAHALRSMEAYFSKTTVAVKLATGFTASAALELANVPQANNGGLTVYWGPIVCLDSNTWTLYGSLDGVDVGTSKVQGFPRKFSGGGITGNDWVTLESTWSYRVPVSTTTSTTTDLKEYWAFSNQENNLPVVDEASYLTTARATNGAPVPVSLADGTTAIPRDASCATPNCNSFIPNVGDAALFDTKAGSDYSTNGRTIYVAGNAQFNHVYMRNTVFITTGTLTLLNNTFGTAPTYTVNAPASAAGEYYYCPSKNTAAFTGKIQFQGFLDVKGNLIVGNGATAYTWALVGVVSVGDLLQPPPMPGTLQINGNSALAIYYDDTINHNITVTPFQIQIDYVRDIPATH